MAGICDAESKQHKDASPRRMKKDEDDVHKVQNTIESWVSPFKSRDRNEPLSNIASGVKATDCIWSESNRWHCRSFADCRSEGQWGAHNNRWEDTASNWRRFDRGLFARMVVIAQHRRMNMQDVLKYSLGPRSAMANRNSRWCPCEDRQSYPASHHWWKGWSCWSCAILRRVDPGWNCFATSPEILPQDIQRASQLRASLDKIDLAPAQHNDWPDYGSVPCNFYQEPRVQEGLSRSRSKVEARNAPHSGRNVCVMPWIRQTWQPLLCKSGSNHTAGRSLPALVSRMIVTPCAECHKLVAGRTVSPAVGWMKYAHSKRKWTPASYCTPAMHHLVSMTASSSSHQTPMLACTFSHRINGEDALLCRYKAVTDVHRHHRHRTVTRCMRTIAKYCQEYMH